MREYGLTQKEARQAIKDNDGILWRIEAAADQKGRPKVLRPLIFDLSDGGEKTAPGAAPDVHGRELISVALADSNHGNTPPLESATGAGCEDSYFRGPMGNTPTEINLGKTTTGTAPGSPLTSNTEKTENTGEKEDLFAVRHQEEERAGIAQEGGNVSFDPAEWEEDL